MELSDLRRPNLKNRVNKTKLITQNAIYLLVGRVVSGSLSLLLMAAIARKLGVDKFGAYTLALTIAGIFGVVSDFGSSYLTVREVAKDKSKNGDYLLNGTIVKIFLNVVFFLILFLLVHFFYKTNLQTVIYLACAASILGMFIQFYLSFFNAYEKMQFTSILTSLQSILVSSVCLAILFLGLYRVNYLFYGHIVVNFLVALFSILLLFKFISPEISKFDLSFSWSFFIRSIPFGLFFMGGVVYFQTDTIMLSIMKNQVAVGLYQAPMRLVMIFEIIPFLLSTAMYPTISKTYLHSIEEAEIMLLKAIRYMLFMGLPIAMGMTLLSKEITLLVYGKKFLPSVLLLQILAWVIPIRFCGHILGTTLSASDNQNIRALATGLSACLNIGLNLILIPLYSYNGAAIASVITCVFLVIFYYYSIKREFFHVALRKIVIPPVVSCLIMGAVMYLIKDINLFGIIALGAVVYLVCLTLFKGINEDDIRILKRIFSNE
jgi:O-antigen/teichoic acid export membrane protein